MTAVRTVALALPALFATFAAWGQSVVSTHSGVVYFFAGSVFIGNERLEQKFGRFPDIPEGGELRTEQGRAEVLLTPGVILRVAESSSVRMVCSKLSDTRVELLTGSAIVEASEEAKGAPVVLIYKNWQARIPQQGVYRIDAEPARIRAYRGEVEVAAAGQKDRTRLKEGENLPLAEVLLSERSTVPESDSFKTWAMSRSQAITADNTTAAGIIDDPSLFDSGGLAVGGYTYFPPTGSSSLGVVNPYGVSFWSSYQSILNSLYVPPTWAYFGLPLRTGYGGSGWPVNGWRGGTGISNGLRPIPRPIYPVPISTPWHNGLGVRPGAVVSPRAPAPTPLRTPPVHIAPPHAAAPSVGVHAAPHR